MTEREKKIAQFAIDYFTDIATALDEAGEEAWADYVIAAKGDFLEDIILNIPAEEKPAPPSLFHHPVDWEEYNTPKGYKGYPIETNTYQVERGAGEPIKTSFAMKWAHDTDDVEYYEDGKVIKGKGIDKIISKKIESEVQRLFDIKDEGEKNG